MFIRWMAYRTRNPQPWSRQGAVRAVLVESRRVNGKPRLQHIAMLASFDPGDLDADRWQDPSWARRHAAVPFWRQARKTLDRLGLANTITPDDRAKIESAMKERIPIPTPEDEQAFDADRAAAVERVRAAFRSINETFASLGGRPRRRPQRAVPARPEGDG
jgi:hypothetical protein